MKRKWIQDWENVYYIINSQFKRTSSLSKCFFLSHFSLDTCNTYGEHQATSRWHSRVTLSIKIISFDKKKDVFRQHKNRKKKFWTVKKTFPEWSDFIRYFLHKKFQIQSSEHFLFSIIRQLNVSSPLYNFSCIICIAR